MTKEQAQLKTNELLEKLGDKFIKDGIEYFIKNVMPHPKENNENEFIVLVHLSSTSVSNFLPVDYSDFILQYQPVS